MLQAGFLTSPPPIAFPPRWQWLVMDGVFGVTAAGLPRIHTGFPRGECST